MLTYGFYDQVDVFIPLARFWKALGIFDDADRQEQAAADVTAANTAGHAGKRSLSWPAGERCRSCCWRRGDLVAGGVANVAPSSATRADSRARAQRSIVARGRDVPLWWSLSVERTPRRHTGRRLYLEESSVDVALGGRALHEDRRERTRQVRSAVVNAKRSAQSAEERESDSRLGPAEPNDRGTQRDRGRASAFERLLAEDRFGAGKSLPSTHPPITTRILTAPSGSA